MRWGMRSQIHLSPLWEVPSQQLQDLWHLLYDIALGKDLGIVMAKGVVIGVLCCVTLLPSLILIFDRAIEKTKHRPLIKSIDKPSAFITKHYRLWLILFAVLLFPAIYGNIIRN